MCPWASKAQRLFNEQNLPPAKEKIRLHIKGKELLAQYGYHDIGMDHFALPHDELYKARVNGDLHRNFMGYTTQNSGMLIGLGVSAISDTGTAYAQNEKTVHDYYKRIHTGTLAVKKGYFLSKEDAHFRKYILGSSCKGETIFRESDVCLLKQYSFSKLENFAADGLVHFNETGISLTQRGQHFVRNVCSAFDLYLQRNAFDKIVFSRSV